jgi:hypothetical protein
MRSSLMHTFLMVSVGIWWSASIANAQVSEPAVSAISSAAAVPNVLFVGQAQSVTITVLIPASRNLLANVYLLRYDANNVARVIGSLHDDGLNGDVVAGDGVYTAVLEFRESSPGMISLAVSAAFRGQLQRITSTEAAIDVQPVPGKFSDPTLGVAFNVPSGWLASRPSPDAIELEAIADPPSPDQAQSLEGGCKISFVFDPDSQGRSVSDWIALLDDERGLNGPQPLSSSLIAVGGRSGIERTSMGLAFVRGVLVPAGDRILSINLYCGSDVLAAGTSVFREILDSVRFY